MGALCAAFLNLALGQKGESLVTRLLLAAGFLALLSAAAPSIGQPENDLSRWKANMTRHQQVLMHGIPAPYDKMRDPSPDNAARMRVGAALFARHCSSCHGWSGRGG
jgi:hypothetical protein